MSDGILNAMYRMNTQCVGHASVEGEGGVIRRNVL